MQRFSQMEEKKKKNGLVKNPSSNTSFYEQNFLVYLLIYMYLTTSLGVAYFIDQSPMYINLYSHIKYGKKDQMSKSLV